MSSKEDFAEAANALRITAVGEEDDEFRTWWKAFAGEIGPRDVFVANPKEAARIFEEVMRLLSRRSLSTTRKMIDRI